MRCTAASVEKPSINSNFDIAAAVFERRQGALGPLQPIAHVQTRIDADVPPPALDRARKDRGDVAGAYPDFEKPHFGGATRKQFEQIVVQRIVIG